MDERHQNETDRCLLRGGGFYGILIQQSIPRCPGPFQVGRENREAGARPARDRRRNGRA
ncbi:hypothetical protein SUBVAR_05497 [Subdoligranulum variabile DSM 15176]|uniref:Uncharacterized protein n=1 Tax=Subdoligranulum variabile DSM 15176 TaxID=411471 RepID=D1PMD7_9FIRM|nr:hypothetical protein SUBVAR_05497 [Subdoligranulum variabile DSM 15176]